MQGSDLPPRKGATFLKTCFNGLNALSGIGILSVPFALSEGGWLSFLLLFLVATVCYYTALLLRRCMDSNILVKTYPDVGELAFGRKGRIMIATFMYLELYLAAIEFLIMEGDNLEKLFPNTEFKMLGVAVGGKQAFVILTAVIILPTTWLRSLGVLAYVSFGGVVASLILLGCVMWVATIGGVGFHERGTLFKWTGVPTTVSLYVFCYSGHSVFPTIYTSMKDRGMFSRVLLSCFLLCTFSYASMAIFGYLMYGSGIKSQITLNLPTQIISSKLAIYTTLVNPLTKYALLVTPIASAIEECFVASKFRSISILIRTLLVVSTVVAALTIPFFAYLMALTGAFLSTSASILLPCMCYLKIFKDERRWSVESTTIVAIIVMGFTIAVVGTYSSIKQIVSNLTCTKVC
uniref:Vacuolar amino acid transporter 1 n=1 Tax=Anthurium amnicola TaxID=1678845 RepID=A0A1D1XF63_9ARAE